MKINLGDKAAVLNFLEAIEAREDWVSVVKFGMRGLSDDQSFLIRLIAHRAVKEASADKNLLDYLTGIIEDLNLKLTTAED